MASISSERVLFCYLGFVLDCCGWSRRRRSFEHTMTHFPDKFLIDFSAGAAIVGEIDCLPSCVGIATGQVLVLSTRLCPVGVLGAL